MPRKGRGTELVLQEMEAYNLGEIARVESPGYVMDKVTGEDREVDILISFTIGSHSFLTVIECRDRKAVQDATWIEQISTKVKDIGANRVIAVSTSGFTKGATMKAKSGNVVLRTLRSLTPQDTVACLDDFKVYASVNLMNLTDAYIKYIENGKDEQSVSFRKESRFVIDKNSKIFQEQESGEMISINHLVNLVNDQSDNFLFGDIIPGEMPVTKKVCITPDKSKRIFQIIEGNTYYVKKIEMDIECSVKVEHIPFLAITRYEEGIKPLIDRINYQYAIDGNEILMIRQKDYVSGRSSMTVRFMPSDN